VIQVHNLYILICISIVIAVFSCLIQLSVNEIIYLRFQDSRGITREADRHHYPPCFRVLVSRQNPQARLDTKFEICIPNGEVVYTLNLLVPGNHIDVDCVCIFVQYVVI